MNDMPLLDYSEGLARLSDPVTSHKAAAIVKADLNYLRRLFVDGIKACGGRATSNEAAAAMSNDTIRRESIRKRAKECVDVGYVRIIGKKTCSVNGSKCQVYEVV